MISLLVSSVTSSIRKLKSILSYGGHRNCHGRGARQRHRAGPWRARRVGAAGSSFHAFGDRDVKRTEEIGTEKIQKANGGKYESAMPHS